MTPSLWLPGRPFLDSVEAYALDDLQPTPDRPPRDPWGDHPTVTDEDIR